MGYEEWDVWTRGSAIRRAGYAGFRRNVAVAIGNWLRVRVELPGQMCGAPSLSRWDHERTSLEREAR
jgi:epoxyqueuosine reductase QueG